jgi:hypothetical protein
MIKKCKKCGKDFKSYPSRKRRYCSRRCSNFDGDRVFKNGHKWVGKLRTNGIWKRSQGYIEIYSPYHPYRNTRNTVLKHRLVMEEYIKRFLTVDEIVHHINGDKNDNRIENLELFSSQSEHIIKGHNNK